MNWTTPTKTPRYFAGSFTTAHDERGWVPDLTCRHIHRSREQAEKCATLKFTWVVYKQQFGHITRVIPGKPLRAIYCHGCGESILADQAHWHNGEGYCDDCEAAPPEQEAQ